MLRALSLADAFTVANAAAGTLALFVCLQHLDGGWVPIEAAFALLPLALVCDVLDGRVARWRGGGSVLGGDLDSLADVISFGVAPAVLGFTLGLRGGFGLRGLRLGLSGSLLDVGLRLRGVLRRRVAGLALLRILWGLGRHRTLPFESWPR